MKKYLSFFICISIVLFSFLLVSCEKKDKLSLNNKEKIENLQLPNEKENFVDIQLYFDASKDGTTEEIAVEERLINKEELIGEFIVQELIKGPSVKSELKPILPKETRLLSFSISDGIACINFGKEVKIAMTQVKEKACLTGLVSSLTKLPSVDKIQILIENKNVDTLGGNYDISTPFEKNDIDVRIIE
jgi:germination protein M